MAAGEIGVILTNITNDADIRRAKKSLILRV
jgi:hypothetical protein